MKRSWLWAWWLCAAGCAVGDDGSGATAPGGAGPAGPAAAPTPDEAAEATLDAFHRAAAVGDETTYFRILPDDATFLGTAIEERWSGAEFRKFAMPYFQRDSAWVYEPVERWLTYVPSGDYAWFDEILVNDAYGKCRGSGVLQRRDGAWVIVQYNLSIPVPNELAKDLVARIRALASRPGK